MPQLTSRRSRGRLALAGCAVFLALPLAASAAHAAEIADAGDAIVYRADPGEGNAPMLYPSARGLSITDPGAGGIRVSGARCHSAGEQEVHCDVPAELRLELGDGVDRISWSTTFPSALTVVADGGMGDDELEANEFGPNPVRLLGGDGDDELTGHAAADRLEGGAGADLLQGGGGDDVILGGDGRDHLRGDPMSTAIGHDVLDGGPDHDVLRDWDDPSQTGTPPVALTLNGQADDGRPGERDDVTGVEEVHSYPSGTFELSDGADTLHVYATQDEGASTARGLGGDDVLVGYDHSESLDGGAGADDIEGGFGDDTLTGGPGRDTLTGDSRRAQCGGYGQSCVPPFGNDVIHARDGEVDSVDCGVGSDTVVADAADLVAANCETVQLPPTDPADPSPGGVPGPAIGPVEPRLHVRRVRLRRALARGLRVKVEGARPGRHTVTARAGRAVRARATVRVGASGRATTTLRFNRAARRSLARRRAVRLTVAGAGARASVRLSR